MHKAGNIGIFVQILMETNWTQLRVDANAFNANYHGALDLNEIN